MENQTENKKSKLLKIIKAIALGVLGVAASMGGIGYVERFLKTGAFGDAWVALVFVLLFLVIATIETFFVKKTSVLFLMGLAQSGAPLLLFIEEIKTPDKGGTLLLIAAAVLFVFQIVGMRAGKETIENCLKIKVFQVTKMATPKIMTGVIAFISILFYLSYFVWGGWSDNLGKRISNEVWKGAEPVLRTFIEGARADQTVDEFLEVATEAELRKLKTKSAREEVIDFDVDLLAPEERAARVREIVEKLKSEVERVAGPVEGSEKMGDVFYGTLKKQWKEMGIGQGEVGQFAGIIMALLVFGFLKSLAFFITWIAEIGAFVMFKLLLAVGFGEIVFESASREKIEL